MGEVVTMQQQDDRNGSVRLGASADREMLEHVRARRAVLADPVLRLATLGGLGWLVLYAVLTGASHGSERWTRFVSDVLYVVPVAAAAILAVVAARRYTGRTGLLWRLLAVSNGLWLCGDLIWTGYAYLTADGAPFPSVADGLYLTSYVLVVPAVLVGFAGTNRIRRGRGLLDMALIVLGVGSVGWQVLVRPQLGGVVDLVALTGVAYPLLGLAIVSCLLAVGVFGHRMVPYSVLLTGVAFAVSAVTDTGYTYLTVVHSYLDGSWLNLGWQAEAVLLCLAALVAVRHREADARVQQLDRDFAMVAAAVSTAAVCALVALDKMHDGDVSGGTLVTAAVMLAGLLVRQVLTTGDRTGLARQLQAALVKQERLAITDSLTGLYNRRFFQEMLRREADRAARQGQPLSLLVLDLDHFKRVNDGYGHPAGDQVLIQAADRIRQAVRAVDIVARYGGEEFVCLLPDAGEETAIELAERLRVALARNPMPVGDGHQITVSASIGIAVTAARTAGEDIDIERVVKNADQALYRAKDQGRNRWALAGHADAAPAAAPATTDRGPGSVDGDVPETAIHPVSPPAPAPTAPSRS